MGENYFGITDAGRQRKNNEDRFIAQTVYNNRFTVACVIDGVGGYAGGEVAALLTSEEILNGLAVVPENIIDHLKFLLDTSNERIIREKEVRPQNENMACVVTLAIVDLNKNVFYFAHVGDTRLYLFRDGSLIKITRDHSNVGFLEESGRLTEEAAMQHPKRNEVNKALGYEAKIGLSKDFIDTGESPFLPGDTILLCSDGLSDMIPSNKIISILSGAGSLSEKGRLLIDAANDAGGKDNITVVIVHNDKSPVQHASTKPLPGIKKNDHNGNGELPADMKDTSPDIPVIKKNNDRNIIRLLLLLCAILISGLAWLMYKNYGGQKDPDKPAADIIPKQRNKDELNFVDGIRASQNNTVNLNDSQVIVITEAVQVANDTLHIIGKGAILVRDSAYSGPAFILSSSCKYVLLNSLSIQNFETGILIAEKGLHLKNVQFINCRVPLQFQHQLTSNKLITGTQADMIFYSTDSLKR